MVAALEAVFPDQVPEPSDSDREVWMKVGNIEVVRFLKAKAEEQDQTPFEDD